MEIIINLVPIIFFFIIFKINKEKNHNLVNMIFNATLCSVALIIIGCICVYGFKIDLDAGSIGIVKSPLALILNFIFGALLEETIKFIFGLIFLLT